MVNVYQAYTLEEWPGESDGDDDGVEGKGREEQK